MKAKILLIDDDPTYVESVRLLLQDRPEIEIIWAASGAAGIQAYREDIRRFAVVIVDYQLPDHPGTEVLKHLRKLNPDQEFLFTTGHRESEFLIDLLETGGTRGFIAKGKSVEDARNRILEAVRHYWNERRIVANDDYEPSKAEIEIRSEGLLGRSAAMLDVVEKIRKFRDKPYSTVVVGPSGAGKEAVIRALVPKGKKLIDIHCGRFAESEQMLESELFGHVKGAFTGATHDKPGRLAQAHGQVVFFDELHTLPKAAQQKLLRFLETMKYRRMGDDAGAEISIDFRVLAATQPDIYERIERGEFLGDLLGRIGDYRIQIPGLSERPEDIEPIIRHFQDEFNAAVSVDQRKQFRISTVHEMKRHPWPLNIRELRGAVRTMMTLAPGDIINPSDFDSYLKSLGKKTEADPSTPKSLDDVTSEVEIDQIRKALTSSRTVSETAKRLRVTRWALSRMMNRHGIEPHVYLRSG